MLRELSIRNFAIIDDLRIRFSPGLTILTGETGAGKSIIINAVNLLLGSRASARLVRTGAESAELEALFDIDPESAAARVIAEGGYENGRELLIRRIISRNEQNRLYINGRLATMQTLAEATENQASISGQHAHQGLLKEEEHLEILDRFGGLLPAREAVRSRYHRLAPLVQEIGRLEQLSRKRTEHMDLLRFQEQEITSAALLPKEDEALEQERLRLRNAEAIYAAVHGSLAELYAESGSVSERLNEVRKSLEKTAQFDPVLSAKAEAVAAVSFTVDDIARGLDSYLGSVLLDEQRLDAVEERLDKLNKIKRKYGGSIEAALLHLETVGKELAEVETLSDRIRETEKEIEKVRIELIEACRRLSEARRKAAEALAKRVESELATLKMEKTRFCVSVEPAEAGAGTPKHLRHESLALSESGWDRAAFQISPNIGEDIKPLAAIASGGELSRVVLALKVILSATRSVETIVFDEVDAGIGGGVAETVGKKLKELARTHQVICITHLPQIARFGDHHYLISKQVAQGRTVTRIVELGGDERIAEMARLLGGEKITPTTLKHARELLRQNA